MSLPFWNSLAKTHLSEIIVVLTAAVVVLLDQRVKKLVNGFTQSHGRVFRFAVFMIVCSVGYAALALGTAWALREGLTLAKGAYMAPSIIAILIIVALSAERQKEM
jgi:hypothetical protein